MAGIVFVILHGSRIVPTLSDRICRPHLAAGVMSFDVGGDDGWLTAAWPFVNASLPEAPARVLDVGCGPLGGFVPRLLSLGYDAVGVDPQAPTGDNYCCFDFEHYEPPQPYDAVLASTSLHHVADLDFVVERIAASLVPRGVLVVVEWAWEHFDEATARWCFDRLPAATEPTWLQRHKEEWMSSGEPWMTYFRRWATIEGLHPSDRIMLALDRRFEPELRAEAPYFFPDLADTVESDEQAAINDGAIRAPGLRYVGRRR